MNQSLFRLLALLFCSVFCSGLLISCKSGGSPVADTPSTEITTAEVPNAPVLPPNIDLLGTVTTNALGFREVAFSVSGVAYSFIEATSDTFTMGLSTGQTNETPEHSVSLNTYWISKTLISLAQFKSFITAASYTTEAEQGAGCTVYDTTQNTWSLSSTASYLAPGYTQLDTHPVSCVSWADAQAYCAWFSESVSAILCNLPTEAQWEHTARGTDGRIYPFGSDLPTTGQANFADATFALTYTGVNGSNATLTDGYAATSPVTEMTAGASPFGVLDMAGNLSEWCYDYMDESGYGSSIVTDPMGPNTGVNRVYRGGSWADNLGNAQSQLDLGYNIRSHSRAGADPKQPSDQIGFRVVIGPGAVTSGTASTP